MSACASMCMGEVVWVAYGSNQADPISQLVQARQALAATQGLFEEQASSVYRTPPVGFVEQPDFYNAVVRYRTQLKPLELLAVLQAQEHKQGRVRSFKNAPRTLDLDILLYDRQIIAHHNLTVPHPELHRRAFVLRPLLEIDPQLVHPQQGELAGWLAQLACEEIVKLEAVW